MSRLPSLVRREFRVAFSRSAQPLWFRLLKWGLLLPLVYWLWPTRSFWPVLIGLLMAGLAVHFFYRWKTAAWSRPWGGWNDAAFVTAAPSAAQLS